MAQIHFFPGIVLSNQITQHHITVRCIEHAFDYLQKQNEKKYQYFAKMRVYPIAHSVEQRTYSTYSTHDVCVAASAGGNTLNDFISHHHVKNPDIVAFEAFGLEKYGNDVWHFVGKKRDKDDFQGMKMYWQDEQIGHNSYMIHPHNQTIICVSDKYYEIVEKNNVQLLRFHLHDSVTIQNNETNTKKLLNNVLIGYNAQGNIETIQFIAVMMDLLISAAFSRKIKHLNDMPVGYSVVGYENVISR